MSAPSSDRGRRIALLLSLLAALGALLLSGSWLGDDAYITLRIVENYRAGHGLTWNVGERVQATTHPLWLLLLIGATGITGETYYTLHLVSLLLTLAAIGVLLFALAKSPAQAVFIAASLTASKAFVDFSSGGLENPLTHFLLAIIVALATNGAASAAAGAAAGLSVNPRRFQHLCLACGLLVLNRADNILICAPLLLLLASCHPWRSALSKLVLGFLPLIAWLLFASFYFGTPLPNTGLAKLNTGVSRTELLSRGGAWIAHNAREDLPTIVLILGAFAAAAISRAALSAALAAGAAISITYVAAVGGDFMGGRMFAAPCFVCVAAIVIGWSGSSRTAGDANPTMKLRRAGEWTLAGGAACLLIIAALMPRSPLTTTWRTRCDKPHVDAYGIADEPAFYFPYTGLLADHFTPPRRMHWWMAEGLAIARAAAEANNRIIVEQENVGFFGYYAGPQVYIVDRFALAEPLLARLRPELQPAWRPGHLRRSLPDGYLETLSTGQNQIADRQLAQFYDVLTSITRGPLFSSERLNNIIRFNLGAYDPWLPQDRSR